MKVSVFIPTYNSSPLIRKTLDSLIRQSYKDIEIVCVDDESSDDTIDILNSFSKKDSRISVYCKKNEGSVPFSWNYVFPLLKGEFTIYMSHDDLIEPETIEKLVSKQKSDTDIDCVIPSVVFFDNNMSLPEEKYEEKNANNDMSKHPTISGYEAFDEMLDYSIPGFALWRTNLIRKIGMPTESFNSDEAMQRIWAKHCRKVAFSDAKFGYRQSSNSIVRGLKPMHYFSLFSNLLLFREMTNMENISSERKKSIQYQYFETLFYLDSQYRKQKGNFNPRQKSLYLQMSKESYSELRKNLVCPKSLKGILIYLSAKNVCIYNLLILLAH